MSANPPDDARAMFEVGARVEAEHSGSPFLEFRDGAGRERVLVFAPDAESASVGRRSSSDLVLGWDEQVSRLHARFERASDGWELVDDGFSSNGTFVNERRLSGRVPLQPGDALRFGATRVTFHSPIQERDTAADRPAPAPPAPAPPAPAPPAPAPAAAARPPAPPPVAAAPAAPVPSPAPSPAPTPTVELSTTQRRVLTSLCRPYKSGNRFATPATDDQIAEDLILSIGEVRTHLRILCAKLGIDNPSGPDTRLRLVERGFAAGLVSERDL